MHLKSHNSIILCERRNRNGLSHRIRSGYGLDRGAEFVSFSSLCEGQGNTNVREVVKIAVLVISSIPRYILQKGTVSLGYWTKDNR